MKLLPALEFALNVLQENQAYTDEEIRVDERCAEYNKTELEVEETIQAYIKELKRLERGQTAYENQTNSKPKPS